MSFQELAEEYATAVRIAARASIDAEEEAQLTTPVSVLLSGVAAEAGLGNLRFVRETRLEQTRPDFAAVVSNGPRTQQKGFVELKAPSVSVDTATWTGRNARQWERMTLAALSADHVDHDDDGLLTVAEARAAIRVSSPVLAAAFAPLIDRPVLAAAVQVELGALETLISAVDAERVNRSADRRGDPWLYFYEDFLTVYDPDERRQAGVYFTPIDVVRAMTRMTDQILVERFGRRLGFADPQVVTLDPATGTGTFPLAVIESSVRRAVEARGPAGEPQAAANLSRNLHAFELLPGPYSVAHLRITQRLRALSSGEIGAARVVLTDTLESPLGGSDQHEFFGDAETLAQEQERARHIKLDQHVTVVIGNPPYRRVERLSEGRGTGGWVVDGQVPGRADNRSLFADIYDVANANTIFSHIANLYNLYVYFWRWALWKAFEAHGNGPGVVAFITGSSWLTGPGFIGLRQLVRELCDEAWVLDLGGG